MLEHKILYTADMHGNMDQFKAFFSYAINIGPATVIIGGDLAPKTAWMDGFISAQRDFLKKELPRFVRRLKKSSPLCNVFLMLGNDDCMVNEDVLGKFPHLYQDINGQRHKIDGSHEILGYPYVPISPFGIKDFEKYDLNEPPRCAWDEYDQNPRNCRMSGYKSMRDGDNMLWSPFVFLPGAEKSDSIQRDLAGPLFTADAEKTVYVFHAPPYNTSLDVILSKDHVGSRAVREFIEMHQPYLTLHGHIHETVDMTGAFADKIGQSLAMSPGNHDHDPEVAVLVFDLYRPQAALRLKLPLNP